MWKEYLLSGESSNGELLYTILKRTYVYGNLRLLYECAVWGIVYVNAILLEELPMEYRFKRERADKIPKEKILQELRRVAAVFNHRKFGWREFNKQSNLCNSNTVKRTFGSWSKALDSIGLKLENRDRRKYPDGELFNEMERIWGNLGHRPSRTEWEVAGAKISYQTYKRVFGSWTKACLQFIEFKMGGGIKADSDTPSIVQDFQSENSKKAERGNRTIPLSVRLKVLARDLFRCVLCGRSPAMIPGVTLEIDHVMPFSKGGVSSLSNLRTLCHECNLGKGNRSIETA
ncbi:MAG: HNH endonuclease [Elusimicrobia bacterium]|nr:HNH endonuclease [Candidatus Obscuribacterium magneticum]